MTTVSTLEGRAAIQRNFSKLEEWANRNYKNSARIKAKSFTWERRTANNSTGWGLMGWEAAPLKRTWGSWWTGGSNCTGATSVAWQQRRPTASWTVFTGPEPGE